ncbi:MAG: 1-(5-phosphoribosyl)-5-[(5-phosphoribosylamino)methylideneamino]imidazole-4-carboxamide isomerase [Phaeodactylibacter sp.]|uniref:1-(5-phosphoribosyl)-5-[(5- phosphoribosylamino)methylideneamino]imidazole-4- carboxamide isomerase n=1 Tax=Phaeodactylibacter sp. TaxID=1940289 RepID=UPI0032ECBBCC
MHPIPAIDIIEGKCVRLTQGDYAQKKIYNEDPLEVAKAYEAHGLQRLHLVDLDGAKAKQIVNYKVLEKLAQQTGLHIDFGGGLKSDDDLRIAFESGAQQVTGGTIAVKQPAVFESWLQRFGSARIILGSDVKDGKIAVSGWQEQSEQELFPFLEDYVAKGVKYTICTDVSKDGLLEGTALPLYGEIRAEFPELQLIASGGITDLEELDELESIGCFGAIIGKAIYENKISLKALEQWVLRG